MKTPMNTTTTMALTIRKETGLTVIKHVTEKSLKISLKVVALATVLTALNMII